MSQQEAHTLARQWRCEYVEVSSKLGVNVTDCFLALLAAIRARRTPRPNRRGLWRVTSGMLQRMLGFA